jgi:hypothetical protein
MRRLIITTVSIFIFFSASYGRVALYLGLRGGAGALFTRDQFSNFSFNNGYQDISRNNTSYAIHAKAEALLGFGRWRIGYRFMYSFGGPNINSAASYFSGDNNRATTYYNNSHTNLFCHYLVIEHALINRRHFALVPGIGGGWFSGYKVDNNTGEHVPISDDTHHRFTFCAELNFEIIFGRFTVLLGPNYYVFCMQDRGNNTWWEIQNFVGADVGLRFNLIKPGPAK